MNKALVFVAFLAAPAVAWAQNSGDFGAGVVVGDPTGITAKYWLDSRWGVDAGVGFSGDAAFYGDLVYHGWDVLPQPKTGRLAATLGLGPRIETNRDTVVGLRTMAGLDYMLPRHPVEVFFEVGPVFRFEPDRGVDWDAGLGLRFYFGGLGSRKAGEGT